MVVYVEADDEATAERFFRDGEWKDSDLATAELVDWSDAGKISKED